MLKTLAYSYIYIFYTLNLFSENRDYVTYCSNIVLTYLHLFMHCYTQLQAYT